MIVAQLIGWLLPVIASVAIAFWMRHRMYADDNNWFECFWNALITWLSTLWNAMVSFMSVLLGMHTPSPAWPSSQQSNTALLILMKAIEDEINDVVDIDYEQPQTMYPELPEMEYE